MEIVLYPAPILTQVAQAVDSFDDQLRTIVQEMATVMRQYNGIGLAAPQVGISRKIILVGNLNGAQEYQAYINPSIVKRKGRVIGEEGCLSFPGIYGHVTRAQWIRVQAYDLDGQPMEWEAQGMAARVLQHEIDHLEGIVFIDKFQPAEKVALKQKLKAFE